MRRMCVALSGMNGWMWICVGGMGDGIGSGKNGHDFRWDRWACLVMARIVKGIDGCVFRKDR